MESGDRVFCHVCQCVWPKENGLICPSPLCQSEFTEIIEIPSETRETPPPLPEPSGVDIWEGHNSLRQEDRHGPYRPYSPQGLGLPSSAFPYNNSQNTIRTYQSWNGNFPLSPTYDTRSSSRPGPGTTGYNPMVPPVMETFNTLLQNLMPPNDRQEGFRRGDTLSSTDPDWMGDDHLTGHHPGLFPRNTERAQPRNQIMQLQEMMNAIRAEMEATQVTRGAPNALSILSLILNTRDRNGVQSQEEMDRVITQLMEESLTTGTAAPPASENAIRSLPKKKVDKDMLGVEGKAECSICMDGVEVDIEVAVLPCTHWFHSDCIGAWLKQHNTCPHCRRSINLNVAEGYGTCENPVVIQDSPEQPQSRRRLSSARTMRSGRSSLSSLQSRLSSRRSPEPEVRETGSQQSSRGQGEGQSLFSRMFRNNA